MHQDPDTLYGYIMSTGPVQPIDVLNILLEYHGLSYKAPYGLQARDLFVKLFMQHSGKLDAMLDACEKSTTTIRGSITLKQWLTSNKQLLYRLYDMIGFSIAFNREPINIYLDPTVLCNKCDIKYVTFPSHNGIKKTPLVAELIKPTQYNGHLIVALCATDIMLLDITDLEVFNKVREFEKLYCGKIAIVCSLGIHVSHTYKPPSDLVLIDLTTARKVFI